MSPCTLEQHREEVDGVLGPLLTRIRLRSETLRIDEPALHGRCTAEPVSARLPIPAFDNSQMDGYAVIAADLAAASASRPVSLPVGVAAPAGEARREHVPGTATPVMTGAPIPLGADAVVPIEEADPPAFPPLVTGAEAAAGRHPEGLVAFQTACVSGRFVRRQGEDLEAGTELLPAGTRLTATRIGALAAAGVAEVSVLPRLRVLLITTGDELETSPTALSATPRTITAPTTTHGASHAPDAPGATNAPQPQSGRIPDANGPMLAALLTALGCEVRRVHTSDSPERLLQTLGAAAPATDLIVTMGGISAGAFEVVREALTPLGGEFHSVSLQPGGPQGFGAILLNNTHPTPVLCFPGNPVSSYLSAELFLLPWLRELAGQPRDRVARALPLAHDVDSPPAKHQLRRGTVDAEGLVHVSHPGSHLVAELAAAEILVHLPIGVAHATAGTLVDTWSINDD